MNDLLRLAMWFIFIMAAGWGITAIALYKKPILFLPEKAALSYCLGLGFVTMEMLFLSIFNIRFSIISITTALFPLFLFAGVLNLRSKNMGLSYRRPSHNGAEISGWEKFFVCAIIFEIFYAFFRALIKPMEAYDAIAIFALKSKAFYLSSAIPHDFFKVLSDPVCHPEYPLLLPLAESSVYVFLGSLNDLLVKAIFPLYYCAALAIFYFVVYRSGGRKIALLFTFLLATIPQFNEYAAIGYADMPLAVYYSAGFFYLILWLKERKSGFLVLSFLMSTLSVWTKTEGLMLVFVNIIVAVFCIKKAEKKPARETIMYITALAVLVMAVLYTKRMMGLTIHGNIPAVPWRQWTSCAMSIKNIPFILYSYQIQFFGPKKWNIVWILFIAAFILNFKEAFKNNLRPVTLAILFAFAGYTFIYLMIPAQDLAWELSKTTSRFFIHFLPLVLLWLATLFKDKKMEI